MQDLAIALDDRPGALADMGAALGRAGVSVEGGERSSLTVAASPTSCSTMVPVRARRSRMPAFACWRSVRCSCNGSGRTFPASSE